MTIYGASYSFKKGEYDVAVESDFNGRQQEQEIEGDELEYRSSVQ